MKNIIIFFIMTMYLMGIYSQEIRWPLESVISGEGVIYRPQDYIGNELNFGVLFITAPEGTGIIAPVTGKISACYYSYMNNLNNGYTFTKIDIEDEEQRNQISHTIWEKYSKKVDLKNITMTVGIRTEQGDLFYISGIYPIMSIKTGMPVNQGEKIGTIGYSYKAIKQPSVSISRTHNGRLADPMAPFGLKSTFIPPKAKNINPRQKYTAAQLQADFSVIKQSLEEGHPGLYDYWAKPRMDSLFNEYSREIKDGMNLYHFYRLTYSLLSQIGDGHIHLSRVYDPSPSVIPKPTVTFSLFNDTLRISRVSDRADLDLLGEQITLVDYRDVTQLKTEIELIEKEKRIIQDGFIKSIATVNKGIFFYGSYMENYPLNKNGIILSFADGKERIFPFMDNNVCINYLPEVKYHLRPEADIEYKKINDETALLDINTFELPDVIHDSIRNFIKDISQKGYKNLIIDLRYNNGGDFGELFGYLAHEPYYKAIELKVNQNDTYDFFRYCSNYSLQDSAIFPGYVKKEGKDGFYMTQEKLELYYPNDSVHFAGHLYVLTDERTFSAASVFAGLVHKYKRGVIVGRETGSTYHQIYAAKYANVILPNTELEIRLPLVKIVYDYPGNSVILPGRGVMPDYPFPFSIDELIGEKDVIMDYTLKLIDNNQYLLHEPDIDPVHELQKHKKILYIIICLFIVITLTFIMYNKTRNSKTSSIK